MEENYLAGYFPVITSSSFFLCGGSHVQSSLLPKFALLFLLVSTMLGIRAWGDDLVVVLFEFLDDDTKLAQSCTDWLFVQRWCTFVPDPAMRVTLWALMGAGTRCNEHTQDSSLRSIFGFSSSHCSMHNHSDCIGGQCSTRCSLPALQCTFVYFWSFCSRIFVVTAFLLLRSTWPDGGRCQPRFDVTHQVGSLCELHHTLGLSTAFFFVCSLCATCSLKIDRALRTVFCRAVFFVFVCYMFGRGSPRAAYSLLPHCVFLSILASWYAVISNHKSTTSCLRGADIEHSCPTANLVMLTRHVLGFLVPCSPHVPLMPLFRHKTRRVPSEWEEMLCLDGAAAAQLHPQNHPVVEGRRCAWAESLLRGTGAAFIIIHGGLSRVNTLIRQGFVCVSCCLARFSELEGRRCARAAALGLFGLLRRLRHERAGCSSGGEWLLPRKAPPWAAALSSRSLDLVAAGLGSANTLSRHTPVSAFFS